MRFRDVKEITEKFPTPPPVLTPEQKAIKAFWDNLEDEVEIELHEKIIAKKAVHDFWDNLVSDN